MNRVDTAFILAAGRGERLKPLTDRMPKPLLPYRGKPLLDHILESLSPLKLKRVILNAWHLREHIVEYAEERKGKVPFELKVSTEEELLGTGGGLKKAFPLIDSRNFLMLNGDCLWKGDIEAFVDRALSADSLSTWWLTAVHREQTICGVKNGELVQIGNLWKAKEPEQTGCFTGIQLVQNLDPKKLPDKGDIVRNFWIPQLDQRAAVVRADFQGLTSWTDIGTVERYQSL
ncbi:MAG: nucleotidyl transferase [Bacteriovoracaceae bacterium]|nr:nucleotidyl transferase [Bacteriovoracaceae bacterium]